jgi:hypothetical protein
LAVETAVPELVVTEIEMDPTPLGLTAVISEDETVVKLAAAALPNWTAVTWERFEPMIVTRVPPEAGPDVGLNKVIFGVVGGGVE